jgi:hypothetical protein
MSLFGTRVSIVVSVDREAHRWRVARRCAHRIVDLDDIHRFEWLEGRPVSPPSPVTVVGVLAREGRLTGRRLSTAGKWRGFGATAVLMSMSEAPSEALMLECSFAGIAVVQLQPREEARLVLAGQPGRRPPARRTVVDRWLEETLYGRLLAEHRLPAATTWGEAG